MLMKQIFSLEMGMSMPGKAGKDVPELPWGMIT
jgi:hypothetical protein